MKNIIAIRREDLSKTGEKRSAISPALAGIITRLMHRLIVQPAVHPGEQILKRAFPDSNFQSAGAEISEDIGSAQVIFGLKEIDPDQILPSKTYFLFSHTHKGQKKNRRMLARFIDQKCSVFDYELVTNEQASRLLTAFTFIAGKAGMIDTLWTLGKRLKLEGINNPFSRIPQSIELEDLEKIKNIIRQAGEEIISTGTPGNLPPIISLFMGDGKTSIGAQGIYDLLPVKEITLNDLAEVFKNGSRNFVYKIVVDIPKMYKLKPSEAKLNAVYRTWPASEKRDLYFKQPEIFESSLESILPFCSIVMNCIIWAPKFPRVITNEIMKNAWEKAKTLRVIGDISCDPNGGVEFSKETWIDNPVFDYDPVSGKINNSFQGEGIAIMAVANLPCEFSADASEKFSTDMEPFIEKIVEADYSGSLESAGLPIEIRNACILWKGEFTTPFQYMKEFQEPATK